MMPGLEVELMFADLLPKLPVGTRETGGKFQVRPLLIHPGFLPEADLPVFDDYILEIVLRCQGNRAFNLCDISRDLGHTALSGDRNTVIAIQNKIDLVNLIDIYGVDLLIHFYLHSLPAFRVNCFTGEELAGKVSRPADTAHNCIKGNIHQSQLLGLFILELVFYLVELD